MLQNWKRQRMLRTMKSKPLWGHEPVPGRHVMGLNLGSFMVPPPSAIVGITSKRSAQSLNITSKKPNVKDLATYFSAQIGVAESLRKNAEKRWKEAIRAFNNEPITTPDDSWVSACRRIRW